jgi:hypothetical protein
MMADCSADRVERTAPLSSLWTLLLFGQTRGRFWTNFEWLSFVVVVAVGVWATRFALSIMHGKALGIQRVVGQELQLLALHVPATPARHAPDLDLQVDVRVATGEIANMLSTTKAFEQCVALTLVRFKRWQIWRARAETRRFGCSRTDRAQLNTFVDGGSASWFPALLRQLPARQRESGVSFHLSIHLQPTSTY